MATTKAKKPTNDELLTALRVLEEIGDRGNYVYERIAKQLPKSMQPPVATEASLIVNIVGVDDIYDLSDAAAEKISTAVKEAWKPVSIKVGTKTISVELATANPLEVC